MLEAPRSMLFVSGEKAERFPKAFAAGADLVCIDLEDAVHPQAKAAARGRVIDWLAGEGAAWAGRGMRALRVNGLRTRDGLRDVLALAESGLRLDWLLLPKVEDAADIACIDAWAEDAFDGVAALIETPRGLENAAAIARAIAALPGRAGALMLGGADLSSELGAEFGWEGLRHARGALVNAARSAGLQAWDVPHIDVQDAEALREETRRVLALGYTCKSAIHPRQLETIHAVFTPQPDQLAWAAELLASRAAAADGAFLFQGKLVDAAILKRAQRIAALGAIAAARS